MSITIARLRMRASIPRRLSALAPAVDHAVRHEFAPAVARAQAVRPPLRAVCRIRQLRVRLRVAPRDVTGSKLPGLWAEAFSKALVAAVEHGSDAEVISAGSRAEWVADFLLRILAGDPSGGWAYEEFAAFTSLPCGEAVVALLESMPAEARDILGSLDDRQALGRALGALDSAQAHRVLGLLDRSDPPSAQAWSAAGLQRIAVLIVETAGAIPGRHELVSAARAVAIFLAQARPGQLPGMRHQSAGRVLDALRVIEWLCGLQRMLPPDAFVTTAARALAALRRGEMPPLNAEWADVEPPLPRPGNILHRSANALHEDVDAARELAGVLDEVRREVGSAGAEAARHLEGTWIHSEVAGLFLLVPVVTRLGWPARIRTTALWRQHGPRALTCVLAGTALALLGRPPALAAADPGITLFAGWIGEPDVRGFARWVESGSDEDRRDLLRAMVGVDGIDDGDVTACGEAWPATFARLGRALVRGLADDLRGFRRSSDRFIVDRFISAAGTVRIEPRRLLVSLRPNPLWVAVHLSGLDTAVDGVSWLADRRVELELGGV